MRAPNEYDSSGKVVKDSMQIIARVLADWEVKALAEAPLGLRGVLQKAMQARNLAADANYLADGMLSAAERLTDRELVLYGGKMKTVLGTVALPGEKTSQYQFIFAKKAPSTLLPAGRDARTLALDELEKRVNNDTFAGAQAKKEFVSLGKAIAAEKKALAARAAKSDALAHAVLVENQARQDVVVAVRAMANDVQSHFAKSPATARRVLGYANPAVARKRNAAARKGKNKLPVEAPALPAHEQKPVEGAAEVVVEPSTGTD